MAPRAGAARVRRAQADVRAAIAVLRIAGAGMAGLVAAARASELGAEPVVYEKGTRAGGSMLLSSGFPWRYRSLELFREQCPGGDPVLQRLILERFDDALDWLETKGVELVTRETGNPLTVGARFDPRRAVEALAGDIRFPETTAEPTILATGGFPARLSREHGLLLRANPWSEGDGLELARSLGAGTAGDLGEFYGRAMAAVDEVSEQDFVRLAQLYGRFATVTSEDGAERFDGEPSWSEIDLVQRIATWPGGRAWYEVGPESLALKVRERTVAEMIDAARRAGAPVEERDGRVRVLVRAAVTQTLGGVRVDEWARVLDADGNPVEGLYAAGADVGGISTGGWSSGLATALVLGLAAAESAAG
ncbi:MAG TPA: FAD-binding protein [Gaiellaceae bacterium]|nr:FAD-binding protein [Gaiellaceae bacterium]